MGHRYRPTPEAVYREYRAGVDFNNSAVDLYRCVETNENFFIGKQWEGVKANGLPTPVFNFLKRVVLFSVANVSMDNMKLHAVPLPCAGPRGSAAAMETLTDILNDQFAALFEANSMGARLREFTRNAAVDGDGCTYTYWDPAARSGRGVPGALRTEVLSNTQVLFGNPNLRDVQSQPYLILERRVRPEDLRAEAACRRASAQGAGAAEEEDGWEDGGILPDRKESGDAGRFDALGGDKATVLLRLWRDRETGTVHAFECTRDRVVRREWDLGIRLYPVTWMCWDYVHNCYHGQAMLTGLIPNQIFVNKLFAMSMISLMTLAYPKVVYDKTRIAKWDNRVGAAIGVNGGDVSGVAKIVDPAQISPQISQFIDLAVGYTQKFLGASDVALGDGRPDNTSAIIALQRAAATPMELTKQTLLQSVEDLGRIYMAFMGEYYGRRWVEIKTPYDREKVPIQFDFGALRDVPMQVKLDVGAASYWSEIANQQTLDNLLMQNKITTAQYLERLPAGSISDRETLLAAMRRTERGAEETAGAAPERGEGA